MDSEQKTNIKKGPLLGLAKKTTSFSDYWLMNIIESILQQIPAISQPQKKFLGVLFSTILLVNGKVNLTNLSR